MTISCVCFFFNELISRQTPQMFRISGNPVRDQEEQQNLKRDLTSNLKLEKSLKPNFNISYLLE